MMESVCTRETFRRTRGSVATGSRRLPRQKLNPYKVLIFLLYGEHPSILSWDGDRVTVRNGPFARLLRVPSSRLLEYYEWLEQYGYVDELNLRHGVATMLVRIPERLSEMDRQPECRGREVE